MIRWSYYITSVLLADDPRHWMRLRNWGSRVNWPTDSRHRLPRTDGESITIHCLCLQELVSALERERCIENDRERCNACEMRWKRVLDWIYEWLRSNYIIRHAPDMGHRTPMPPRLLIHAVIIERWHDVTTRPSWYRYVIHG